MRGRAAKSFLVESYEKGIVYLLLLMLMWRLRASVSKPGRVSAVGRTFVNPTALVHSVRDPFSFAAVRLSPRRLSSLLRCDGRIRKSRACQYDLHDLGRADPAACVGLFVPRHPRGHLAACVLHRSLQGIHVAPKRLFRPCSRPSP